jgi:UDP-N-acetylglucosamine 4-epimerase
MPISYEEAKRELVESPGTWLLTGAAGFIGSHLLEELLRLGQTVAGLDNFATGRGGNLEDVETSVGPEAWRRFRLVEGDICDAATCRAAVEGGVRCVVHLAALGSVPRSLADPLATHEANVSGFLNLLVAAREAGIESFVYASSSAVYGDRAELPKLEEAIGDPLSPYAASKHMDEIYAAAFRQAYGFRATGLRYFNVFGPRQDPEGAYAAVIPKWTAAMLRGEEIVVYGDGGTSRDFCFVRDVVQGTLLAALAEPPAAGQVYNIAAGGRTSLNELFSELRSAVAEHGTSYDRQAIHRDFRTGDVPHSQADIGKAQRMLGYHPTISFAEGLRETVRWYREQLAGGGR